MAEAPVVQAIVALSWMLYLLAVIAIKLNLSALFGPSAAWAYVQPRYGLAQRALFAAWFGWAALLGALLSAAHWHEPRAGT